MTDPEAAARVLARRIAREPIPWDRERLVDGLFALRRLTWEPAPRSLPPTHPQAASA